MIFREVSIHINHAFGTAVNEEEKFVGNYIVYFPGISSDLSTINKPIKNNKSK